MELIVFGAIALVVVYVLYKAYGPKGEQAPAVTVADVVAKAEEVVAEAKPAKKKAAAKKPTVKKATTRKPKAK
jgi:hypothetical protein